MTAHHRSHCKDKRSYCKLPSTALRFGYYGTSTETLGGGHVEVTLNMTHNAS